MLYCTSGFCWFAGSIGFVCLASLVMDEFEGSFVYINMGGGGGGGDWFNFGCEVVCIKRVFF